MSGPAAAILAASPPKPPQATPASTSSPQPPQPPPPMDRRKLICAEIVSTEENYAKSLAAVCEVWLNPLDYSTQHEDVPILMSAEIQTIFNNIRLFSEFHQRFLADMKLCNGQVVENNFGSQAGPLSASNRRISVARGSIQQDCWGALFLTFAPFLKMYIQYLNNHANAVKFIDTSIKEQKNKKWIAFMEKSNIDPRCFGNQLQSFLIMPVQRVPRYKLLLAELLKNTPKEHQDYADLVNSLEKIDVVAHAINTGMREQQHQEEILNLQAQFTHPISLIRPGRVLIHTGVGVKRGQHRDNEYFFILFNDLFLYCSGSSGKYKCHLEIPINPQFITEDKILTEGHTEYLIEVQNDIKSFQMVLPSKQEQLLWSKHFKDVRGDHDRKLKSRNSYHENKQLIKTFLPVFDLRYVRRHERNAINIGILNGSLLNNIYFFVIVTLLYIFTAWTVSTGDYSPVFNSQ
jgi:hypothetical protein